ncbi:MAG: hypothetical protein V4637_00005, partial [Pseudomonadota bacterium]
RCLLHQDTVKALGDESGVLISGDDYGREWLRFVDWLGFAQKLLLRRESAFKIVMIHRTPSCRHMAFKDFS